MILPKEDKYYGTKETMREQIIHLLGGRVAEMLTLDDISTGASNLPHWVRPTQAKDIPTAKASILTATPNNSTVLKSEGSK